MLYSDAVLSLLEKVHIFSCIFEMSYPIFWHFLAASLSLSSWLSWVSHGISVSSSLSPSHIPVVPTMKRYKSLKLHQVDREDGHPWKLSSLLYPLIILSRAAAEKKLKDHIHTPSWKIARKLESSQFLVYFMSIWYKTTKRISYWLVTSLWSKTYFFQECDSVTHDKTTI